MPIDRLVFYHEYNVCKCWVVDYCSHVSYQTVHCLVIYFILFKLTDVKDANIVQPLTSIKSSEDEKLFGTNNTSGVPLPPSRCFFKFQRVAPSHCLCVEYIQVIGWNYLFKRSTSAIIPSEKINFVSNKIRCMTSQTFWRRTANLRLCP